MTDQEILDMAREGYRKCGLKPIADAFFDDDEKPSCACVLGSALYASTGKTTDATAKMAKKLGRSLAWTLGCVMGFDGVPLDEINPQYAAGHAFGRKARKKFKPEGMS